MSSRPQDATGPASAGPTSRPKLWAVLGDRARIRRSRGDAIGEWRLLRYLAEFYDVYYNGVLADFASDELGGGDAVRAPEPAYDAYYVRNNAPLFIGLPRPKFYMAYPYDREAFRVADGLVVTTDAWRSALTAPRWSAEERAFLSAHYPLAAAMPAAVVTVPQVIDEAFLDPPSPGQLDQWSYRFSLAHGIGYAGRLDGSVPRMSVQAVLEQPLEAFALAWAGRVRHPGSWSFPPRSVYVGNVPYRQMPAFLGSLRLSLAGEDPDNAFLGSNKVLDSVATGTPVFSLRSPVREEYLGADYLGFFDDYASAVTLARQALFDDDFHEALRHQTVLRRPGLSRVARVHRYGDPFGVAASLSP